MLSALALDVHNHDVPASHDMARAVAIARKQCSEAGGWHLACRRRTALSTVVCVACFHLLPERLPQERIRATMARNREDPATGVRQVGPSLAVLAPCRLALFPILRGVKAQSTAKTVVSAPRTCAARAVLTSPQVCL